MKRLTVPRWSRGNRLQHRAASLALLLVGLELAEVGLRKLAQPLHDLLSGVIVVVGDGGLGLRHASS
jgi:hypothetical protein